MYRAFLFGLLCVAQMATAQAALQLHFVTEDFPPFTYAAAPSNDGQKRAAGPLVEIVEATCERLQAQCRVELLPWRRALRDAEQGLVDGIFTVIESPERHERFFITRMLVRSRYSVYALEKNNFVYHQPRDMRGRIVGAYGPSGTSYALGRILESVPGVTIHLTPNNRRLLKMLHSGRFGPDGVVVANQDVAWHLIEEEQLKELREAGELAEVAYGIGLSRASVSEDQFRRFNQALEDLREEGVLGGILRGHGLEPAW